jgi:long-chain acyl-CoA synthetase
LLHHHRRKERQEALLLRIAKVVQDFPAYATPRAVWVDDKASDLAAGVLTPTLKIKRPAMEQRFAREISALYGHRGDSQNFGANT